MNSLNLGKRWNKMWCFILGHDTKYWFYDPECNRCGAGYVEITGKCIIHKTKLCTECFKNE